MVFNDVKIFRGPSDRGYPFLELRTKIQVIAMAAQNAPTIIRNDEGDTVYGLQEESDHMRMQIRVMLRGAINCGCDALILGAFGCGAFCHPPSEVALIFQEEMELVGDELPMVMFSIIDDHNAGKTHNSRGNYAAFHEVLHQTGLDTLGLDTTRKTPTQKANYVAPKFEDLEVTQIGRSMEVDVSERADRTDGPGANVAHGPGTQGAEGSKDAGGDEPMGTSLPSSAAEIESSPEARDPREPVSTAGRGHGSEQAYDSDAEDAQSLFAPARSLEPIIFKQQVPARQSQVKVQKQKCWIWDYVPAICVDLMAPVLLKYYVNKVEETAKWHTKWDNYSDEQKQSCANKGLQHRGPKT